MRFRFCGDLDCPDWVLAEISILSKVTSVKMKLLCVQVVSELLGGSIDYTKVSKLTADAKYEVSDVKASVAALNYIFSSAGKHNVDGETVSNELQQLGLPKEHAQALCKVYEDKLSQIRNTLRKQSLRLPQLKALDWRVDLVLSSSQVEDVNEPEVQLKLVTSDTSVLGKNETHGFTVSGDKFRVLVAELKRAYKYMEDL